MIGITRKEAGKYLFKYQNLYNPRQLRFRWRNCRFY